MKKWVGILVALALLVGAGVLVLDRRAADRRAKDRREADAVAVGFLRAWQAKRFADMGPVTAADPDAGDSFANLEKRLQVSSATVSPGALSADGKHLPFHVALVLAGLGPLEWDNTLDLVKQRRGWRIAFSSSTVYPRLQNGQQLRRSQPLTSRGQLVDRHDSPIRSADADLAANVLGSTGATRTGLERIYDTQLTGSSGGSVEEVNIAENTVQATVKTFPPHAAAAVRTTLDLPLQKAAEAALVGVSQPAAMVVVDTATSEIRAVVNRPVAGLPAAFRSEAPGSTFKIVVAAAALMQGLSPSSQVDCPPSVPYGGKVFKNDETLPEHMTFATAFALSCNTAFLNIANGFPKGTVGQTSKLFGFGRGALLPTGAEGGDVPTPASVPEAYADIIGQGRVEASPLLLATVSAAVASGTWHQPHLVAGASPSVELPAAIVPALQRLMSGVVTSGTAARAGLPAGTHGKTGTAQYGAATPLRTHAWFTGYRGSLAFCVYVQDGASGGSVAAPVAARFLRAVPS